MPPTAMTRLNPCITSCLVRLSGTAPRQASRWSMARRTRQSPRRSTNGATRSSARFAETATSLGGLRLTLSVAYRLLQLASARPRAPKDRYYPANQHRNARALLRCDRHRQRPGWIDGGLAPDAGGQARAAGRTWRLV